MMLRASRASAVKYSGRTTTECENAKEALVARSKHARDFNGMARAGTTLLLQPLPCELGALSGEEMSEDEEHWFIDSLVWGLYQDALGQEVFLACVSGVDDFGAEVDGILWEQQREDIPPKLVHEYMESLALSIFSSPYLRKLLYAFL